MLKNVGDDVVYSVSLIEGGLYDMAAVLDHAAGDYGKLILLGTNGTRVAEISYEPTDEVVGAVYNTDIPGETKNTPTPNINLEYDKPGTFPARAENEVNAMVMLAQADLGLEPKGYDTDLVSQSVHGPVIYAHAEPMAEQSKIIKAAKARKKLRRRLPRPCRIEIYTSINPNSLPKPKHFLGPRAAASGSAAYLLLLSLVLGCYQNCVAEQM